MIRTLIADDEPIARHILTEMLREHADVVIAGEAGSGTAALRDIERLKPDLVLLDIHMPGLGGFDVVRELGAEAPAIVFVTAFDEYAVRAFEVHAVDYVLKPFDEQRLASALERVRRQLARDDRETDTERLIALLEQLNRREHYLERLAVRTGDRVILMPVADIDYIRADGKFLRITAGGTEHVMRETLTHMTSVLDPQQYLRISRSALVNITSIREIQPWFRGEYLIVMKDGTRLTSTRGFRDNLETVLGQLL